MATFCGCMQKKANPCVTAFFSTDQEFWRQPLQAQWSSPSTSLPLYWDLITNQLENPASHVWKWKKMQHRTANTCFGILYLASPHGCSMNSCAVLGTSSSGREWASGKRSWGVGEIWKTQWDSVCKHGQVLSHRNHYCNCFVWFNVAFLKESRGTRQDANFILVFFFSPIVEISLGMIRSLQTNRGMLHLGLAGINLTHLLTWDGKGGNQVSYFL